jgi:hypothetical protein
MLIVDETKVFQMLRVLARFATVRIRPVLVPYIPADPVEMTPVAIEANENISELVLGFEGVKISARGLQQVKMIYIFSLIFYQLESNPSLLPRSLFRL